MKAILKASDELVVIVKSHSDGKRFLLCNANGVEFIAESKDFIIVPVGTSALYINGVRTCNNCSVPRCNPAHNDSSTPCLHYKLPVSARTGLSQANKTILASCRV